jgi:dienelactone hydrolase
MMIARKAFLSVLILSVASCACASLWDMGALHKQPLDPEQIGGARRVPRVVAGASDWMNTGDAWVAKKKDAGSAPAAKAPDKGEQLLVEDYYYSSESTPRGANRIFCAIARPANVAQPVPVVLIFHGGGGHASEALALAIARRHPGMAGLAMDYNGQFVKGAPHVTQWKNVERGQTLDLVPDASNYPMYHYVTAARRAIDFLETQSWADSRRIGCVGISYGGWVALILAGVDERVKCVTTAVSAGGAQFTSGRAAQQMRWDPPEQRPLWVASYDPFSYAARTKAAVFFQLASNDLFFWLSGAGKNLAALPGEKGWVVRPNSNHGAGGPELPDTAAPAFMRHVLAHGPALPRVTEFQVSGDGTVYTWKAAGPNRITRAVLVWSPGTAVSPGRYWIEFPAQRAGDTWHASVPASFSGLAAQAYVNIGDEQGIVVSGGLTARDGLDPMTESGPQWPGGQLWDVERGTAAWRPPAPGLAKTVVECNSRTGLRLGPDKAGKEFVLLTNSVVLASGVATRQKGLHLRINGNGQAGTLTVTLLRDTNSLDERAYRAEIAYGRGTSEHDIPWAALRLATKNVAAAPMPCPLDGLMLSGRRDGQSPLTLEALTFILPGR